MSARLVGPNDWISGMYMRYIAPYAKWLSFAVHQYDVVVASASAATPVSRLVIHEAQHFTPPAVVRFARER